MITNVTRKNLWIFSIMRNDDYDESNYAYEKYNFPLPT